MSKTVLVSNVMMLNEKERFDRRLRDMGFEPVWARVNQFLREEECLPFAGQIDGWLAGDDRITEKVIRAYLPRLKVISKWGTGIDSIDLAAAKALGLPICNSPGAFGDAVGEYALGLLLSVTRRIALTDRQIRNGSWPKPRNPGLYGKVIGVIGFGAIGRNVAHRARGMKMDVLAFDPMITDDDKDGTKVTLDELVCRSDVICLCCNLTAENFHLIDAARMAQMKPGVTVINVARGGLIDEVALLENLRTGHVAAAALDVFEDEPLGADHPLLALDNVVVSSHNANSATEAIEAVHENTLQNLARHLG
ncbi:phosphoglycerate dehydrogenase [Sinorhizobium alkalisoli]|uniref:D-3-phosphoglycerate dehydrogenase n=1 Tax=Sinorhizobium alkalisoli TaxID=1752398 RepID=A0A1E3V418_9HYPH|nr:phosphoglycerate dehydrogenase [Sinorhizobium alkalisoli]ODR88362.1 hypothetical protein A8M32_25470 [Sinorhizobium alkalisoli]